MKWRCFIFTLVVTLFPATADGTCSFNNMMGDCEGMSGEFLAYDHAHEISSLYIYDSDLTHLTDSDFTPFQSLKTLQIFNCTLLETKGCAFLTPLKHLHRLTITNSNITEECILSLNGTVIRELSLQVNRLTHLSSDFFTQLKKVESVDLSYNYISDIARDIFRNLTFLKRVNLANNSIGWGFDPLSFSLSPSVCSLCDGGRRERCSEGCQSNAEVDVLWRSLDGLEVNLKGNPVCGKVMDDPVPLLGRRDAVVLELEAEWYRSCQLLRKGRCPRHAQRHDFVRRSCFPESNRTQTTPRPDGDDVVQSMAVRQQRGPEAKDVTAGDKKQKGLKRHTWLFGFGIFCVVVILTLLIVPVLARKRVNNQNNQNKPKEEEGNIMLNQHRKIENQENVVSNHNV